MAGQITLAQIEDAHRQIMDHISRNGECGTLQIMAALNWRRHFVDSRIFEMVEGDLIHRVSSPIPGSRGHGTVLKLGPGPAQKGRAPAVEFNRPMPKTWPPHNVRDPLITALFGPANNQ